MSEHATSVDSLRKWLHTFANGLMPIGGTITLMRLGKVPCDDEQLQKLEASVNKLNQSVTDARQMLLSHPTDNNVEPIHTPLYEITYVSQCVDKYKTAENITDTLRDIELSSIRNNDRQSITGALVYVDGYFFQRIEGPEEAVKALMGKILLDPRHRHLSILSSGLLNKANYKKWRSMVHIDAKSDPFLAELVNNVIKLSQLSCHSNLSLAALNMVIEHIDKGVSLHES